MIDVLERYLLSSHGFEQRLRQVRPDRWHAPTPCAEWDVRALVNHTTAGNRNYVLLLEGASAADFLAARDLDVLGADPLEAYLRSVRDCHAAFARPGALDRRLDYPLGPIGGRQALAVRLTDNAIHTWDLAVAVGGDTELDADLLGWIEEHLAQTYAGLAETPLSVDTTHRFFAAPDGSPGPTRQDRLLHLMGRTPS